MKTFEPHSRDRAAPTNEVPGAPPPTTSETVADERPWLVDIEQLAFLLNRSVPSLERDASAGRLPASVRLGHSRRWRRQEIRRWVEAGCPPRQIWETTAPDGGSER